MAISQPEISVSMPGAERPLLELRPTSAEEMAGLRVEPEAISNMRPQDQIRLRNPNVVYRDLQHYAACFLWGMHAIEERGSETHVGIATLAPVMDMRQTVGLAITRKGFQGRGFGLAAVTAITAFAFDRLECLQMQGDSLEINRPMMRAFERAGFVRCDTGALANRQHPDAWDTLWALPRSPESAMPVLNGFMPGRERTVQACARFAARKAGYHISFIS